MATAYLDQALAEFSGYIAADELYDGPYCVLSIVDNREFRRLTYRVLDHTPTHEDILRFFKDFKKEPLQRARQQGQTFQEGDCGSCQQPGCRVG